MQNVVISRYREGSQSKRAWEGSIEPEDRSWILFIPVDGAAPQLYLHRDIGAKEGEEREFHPNIHGEYVEAENFPKGETPTPNVLVEV